MPRVKPRPRRQNRRTQSWRTCLGCGRSLAGNAFYQDDESLTCRRCQRVDGGVILAAPDPAAGVTIPLAGDRVLRVAVLADQVVVTQGFQVARLASSGISPLSCIHVPLRRLDAVRQALARPAPP